MVDKGKLELLVDGLPASLQRAYHLFTECNFPFDNYIVYTYLKKFTYFVFRAEETSPPSPLGLPTETSSVSTATINSTDPTRTVPNLRLVTRTTPAEILAANPTICTLYSCCMYVLLIKPNRYYSV